MDARKSDRSPRAALYVLAHAWYATKPRTRDEAEACRRQMLRTKDFLMHEPATDIAVGGVRLSAAEFEVERDNAVEELRSRCAMCGLCAQHGLTPI